MEMKDIHSLLEKQALWQRSRRSLPWPEKIRMAERVRDSILSLRAVSPPVPPDATAEGRAKNRRVEIVAAVGEIKPVSEN